MTAGNRSVPQQIVIVAVLVGAAVAVAGWQLGWFQGDPSLTNARAEQIAFDILTQDAEQVQAAGGIHNVSCVKEARLRFSCLVDGGKAGAEWRQAISLTCDESGVCLSRPT